MLPQDDPDKLAARLRLENEEARKRRSLEIEQQKMLAQSEAERARLLRRAELRKYYNGSIRPELLRTERMRRSVLFRVGISLAFIALLVTVLLLLGYEFMLVVVLPPVLIYLFGLTRRFFKFRKQFKPAVVQLLLDFMSTEPNLQSLTYDAEGYIEKSTFERSGLFYSRQSYYEAEDFVQGMVGEMAFELCEVYVKEESRASHRFQQIFAGIFAHAQFNEEVSGKLAAWPVEQRKFMHRSIKRYVSGGGRSQENENFDHQFEADFDHLFVVYAHPGTAVQKVLPAPMQDALAALAEQMKQEGNELYFAIDNRELFMAVSHERDLLEPKLLSSNVTFDLIEQFYLDIQRILEILEAFDQNQ